MQAQVRRIEPRGQGCELDIAPIPVEWRVGLGDSIAIDGICLTVEAVAAERVTFYLSQETLACTTAPDWQVSRSVHVEPAMQVGQRLDGHIVQGHVDAVGEVADRRQIGEDVVVGFRFPERLVALLFDKGSVTVDGVSLTVNRVAGDRFEVNVIPHTQQQTHLAKLKPGERVNLETDPIARQVAATIARMQQTGALT